MSPSVFVARLSAGAAIALCSFARAGVTTDLVASSNLGGETTFNNVNAALGVPPATTSFGATTPFNPNFGSDNIVRILPGGQITLRLSSPAPIDNTSAPELGVFTNIGLQDVSADGSGVAGNPAQPFSALPVARVRISDDNVNWHDVAGGALVTFRMIENGYTDTPPYTNYFATPGTTLADVYKAPPSAVRAAGLSAFNGMSFTQALAALDGSAGGEWIDLSGLGLTSFRYVRFEVPAGLDPVDNRMILDAITAVPEPSIIGMLLLGALSLSRKRRSERR